MTLITLLILNILGFLEKFFNYLGYQNLLDHTHSILNTYQKHNFSHLITLSEIEAGIAVIKTTTVGVSFIVEIQTELGQILSSFASLIDTLWGATLCSLTSVGLTKYFLNFFSIFLVPALTIMLVFLILNFIIDSLIKTYQKFKINKLSNQQDKVAKDIKLTKVSISSYIRLAIRSFAMNISKIVLSIFLILPLLLLLTSSFVYQFHLPAKKVLNSHLEKHAIFAELHQESNIKSQAKLSRSFYYKLKRELPRRIKHMLFIVPEHLALVFMDIVLLPGLIALFFLMLYRLSIKPVLETLKIMSSESALVDLGNKIN
jgi:hypothetical protein